MRVSNVSPAVTHSASLSEAARSICSTSPEFMRRRGSIRKKSVRVWGEVLRDPGNADRLCWGQTYRHWSKLRQNVIVRKPWPRVPACTLLTARRMSRIQLQAFDVLRAE